MGIENRDYMGGEASYRRGGFQRSGRWSMVAILIVINVVVFLGQTVTVETHLFERLFALDIDSVLHGQIWRLTTYDFLHETSDSLPLHLLFNMWLLYLAGTRVEARYGSKEFLAFYLVAGVLSGIGFLLWGLITQTPGIAIGASGAAVAVMIVYAMNWPSERWYLWGLLPVPVMVLALLAAAWDVLPMLSQLAGRGIGDNVAHAAHVGGMLFGFLYVHFRWRITDGLAGLGGASLKRRLQGGPKLRVHVPRPEESVPSDTISEDVESRLDLLLEKITQQGEASLTSEERNFLAEASRRYRNRH